MLRPLSKAIEQAVINWINVDRYLPLQIDITNACRPVSSARALPALHGGVNYQLVVEQAGVWKDCTVDILVSPGSNSPIRSALARLQMRRLKFDPSQLARILVKALAKLF